MNFFNHNQRRVAKGCECGQYCLRAVAVRLRAHLGLFWFLFGDGLGVCRACWYAPAVRLDEELLYGLGDALPWFPPPLLYGFGDARPMLPLPWLRRYGGGPRLSEGKRGTDGSTGDRGALLYVLYDEMLDMDVLLEGGSGWFAGLLLRNRESEDSESASSSRSRPCL